MKRIPYHLLWTVMAGAMAVSVVGCKTIARENIISSINTGIGLTVAQNPSTEMYEVKIGYIRNQFYSVPTGKTVEDDSAVTNNLQSNRSNRAQDTPEMVSGIRMESGVKQLLVGLNVSESFAVGATAVMSPAAVAMYIANSENAGNALAASSAAGAVAAASKSIEGVRVMESTNTAQTKLEIMQIRLRSPADKAKVETVIAKPTNGGFQSWNEFLDGNPSAEQLMSILKEIKSP